jgi:hypothetical protein
VLQQGGVGPTQIAQVRGYADQLLRIPSNPLDPSNRRISLIVEWAGAESLPLVTLPTVGAHALPPPSSNEASTNHAARQTSSDSNTAPTIQFGLTQPVAPLPAARYSKIQPAVSNIHQPPVTSLLTQDQGVPSSQAPLTSSLPVSSPPDRQPFASVFASHPRSTSR